jgi:hypothetical protein
MSNPQPVPPAGVDVAREIARLRELSERASLGRAYLCGSPWFQDASGVMVGSPDPHAGYMIADTEAWSGEREEAAQDRPELSLASGEDDAAFLAACWNFVRTLLAAPPPSAWQPIDADTRDAIAEAHHQLMGGADLVEGRGNREKAERMRRAAFQLKNRLTFSLPAPPATRESVDTPDRGDVSADRGET